ncbi:MAG TPA: hypothetical protein VFU82_09245 [Gammaproteobacteria bacterium]|nr:hypothetical protein [Gammaproteobacteria bacterium]
MKKIRIISLGEIVTPNLGNGLNALAKMIAEKSACELKQAFPQVQSAVQKNFGAIEQLKQGLLSEDEFNERFINAIHAESGIQLTVDEFDSAWAAMNPKFTDFRQALETALSFQDKKDQQLILISHTNPKDIRHLVNELHSNDIPYQLDADGNLCEISGIELHTTYANKVTKSDLIKNVIIGLRQSDSPRNRLFSEHKDDSQPDDIKYIHGVNEIQLETLKKDFDDTTSSVQEAAEKFRVNCILWDKKSISMTDILNEENLVHGMVYASALQ